MDTLTLKSSHSTALPASPDGKAPEWVHLLPSGTFAGRDGRGPWSCDPATVIARTKQYCGSLSIPVDYDHQIERAAENGQPAPASGWITDLEAREDGIWGRAEWTAKGRQHLEAREYRYISPVFFHDKKNGAILALESAALTNVPNLAGLKALAASEGIGPTQGDDMSLQTISTLLGVENAGAPVESAVRALLRDHENLKTMCAALSGTLQSPDATPEGLLKAAQAVAAKAAAPDIAKFVPVETYNAVATELAAAKEAQSAVLVKEALENGKITPAQEGWAKATASRDPEGFKAFLATAPDMRPGGGDAGAAGAAAKTTPPGKDKGILDATDKEMCRALGISEEAFLTAQKSMEDDDGSTDQ